MNPKPLTFAWPLLLCLLSFTLTLHGLAADSFWGDEILTASFASRSYPEIMAWTASDIHPPLYYFIAGTFTHLIVPLGVTSAPTMVSDWLWRFPSVMAVVLTVALTFRVARQVSSVRSQVSGVRATSPDTQQAIRHTTIVATLLVTLAPIVIKYGQEARMHALFMCLSLLSTWLLFRAMAQPTRRTRWLVFALATAANIYTMYFGFLILATHAGFVLAWLLYSQFTIHNSQFTIKSVLLSPLLLGFSGASLLVIIFYLPWWPILFTILRNRAAVGAIEGGVGSPLVFINGVVNALGPQPTPVAWGFFILFLLGLMLLARHHWPSALFGLLWLGLPSVLPIFLGDPRALQFRYAFILPLYLIIVGYTIVSLSRYLSSHQIPTTSHQPLATYLIWLLTTLSFIATLGIYQQSKPNWRDAAAYLNELTKPADIILIGPLWDEGRFIEYYYQGQAQLLTPAALVTNIQGRVAGLREGGGRIWAVNRFAPTESAATQNVKFSGVVISEPLVPVYEPDLLSEATLDLARQATEAASPWATEAQTQGVLDPDPRTARAAALRAWGDTLVAAGRLEEAVVVYQEAVDIFPGWVNGYLALAETQEAVGNLPAAVAAYQAAVKFKPEWQGQLAAEAAAQAEAEQWDAALALYQRIILD